MNPGSLPPLTRSAVMPRRLKVFRTTAGFHDAYVAAPSRAAALRAWGAKGDLFAREAADEVTEPELMAEPLAHPGEVIRRPRGSFVIPAPKSEKTRRTPPSRAALDKAEAAVTAFEERAVAKLVSLRHRQDALARERSEIEAKQRAERERLEERRDREREKYDAAIARQRGGTESAT